MGIIVKNALVEIHHYISVIKRYHGSLRQVYSIITIKIPGIESDLALQMFFKAINNVMSSHWLVSTLLIFGAYPMITEQEASFLSITQRVVAMQ